MFCYHADSLYTFYVLTWKLKPKGFKIRVMLDLKDIFIQYLKNFSGDIDISSTICLYYVIIIFNIILLFTHYYMHVYFVKTYLNKLKA